jgi:hypothetical protein
MKEDCEKHFHRSMNEFNALLDEYKRDDLKLKTVVEYPRKKGYCALWDAKGINGVDQFLHPWMCTFKFINYKNRNANIIEDKLRFYEELKSKLKEKIVALQN